MSEDAAQTTTASAAPVKVTTDAAQTATAPAAPVKVTTDAATFGGAALPTASPWTKKRAGPWRPALTRSSHGSVGLV
jgi:hypothetical protein